MRSIPDQQPKPTKRHFFKWYILIIIHCSFPLASFWTSIRCCLHWHFVSCLQVSAVGESSQHTTGYMFFYSFQPQTESLISSNKHVNVWAHLQPAWYAARLVYMLNQWCICVLKSIKWTHFPSNISTLALSTMVTRLDLSYNAMTYILARVKMGNNCLDFVHNMIKYGNWMSLLFQKYQFCNQSYSVFETRWKYWRFGDSDF